MTQSPAAAADLIVVDERFFINQGSELPCFFEKKKAGAACLHSPGGKANSLAYQFLTIVKPITRPMSDLMMS